VIAASIVLGLDKDVSVPYIYSVYMKNEKLGCEGSTCPRLYYGIDLSLKVECKAWPLSRGSSTYVLTIIKRHSARNN